MKEVTVSLTLEWTFDQQEWSEENLHIKELIADPKQTFGYDTLNSIFILNDITYPTLTNCKVVST